MVLNLNEVSLLDHPSYTCGDPESFVRGGPTLTRFFFFFFFFSLMRGRRNQIPLLAGHSQPASERADDGPTLNAGMVAL